MSEVNREMESPDEPQLSDLYGVDGIRLWGLSGEGLIHGWLEVHGFETHRWLLARTGPFVPPISFPFVSKSVFTEEARYELKMSDLRHNLNFKQVDVTRAVRSDWHTWDLRAEDLTPECTRILDLPHDTKVLNEMPTLWGPIDCKGPRALDPRLGRYHARGPLMGLNAMLLPRDKYDLVCVRSGHLVVNETGKSFLERRWGEWLRFMRILSLP